MEYSALNEVLAALDNRLARQTSDRLARYCVPGLWVDPCGHPRERTVTPEAFFVDRIARILAQPATPLVAGHDGPGDWGRYAVAYNLLVRAGAAWDHDGDGEVGLGPNRAGWRETGTFLKAMTLLPLIRSLGCNTVHLLPITAIGRDGKKGNLGSPFAIRDPYALDDNLAEPALGLGAQTEFAAFVEAAHHLGLRVIVEFVFRTGAKDSVWARTNPEWFYWIRAEVPDRQPGEISEEAYGSPQWTDLELRQIYGQVATAEYLGLPVPHPVYRRMFLPPPRAEDVRLVEGAWRGTTLDPQTGRLVTARIPGAFADWTPDSDQPPWSDVTYLRMYDHPDFNYIAYNTVRMYERRLAQPENAVGSLWERIAEIIPHYQRSYGIDGVMIDMGHALPVALKQRIVSRARAVDPDFALWAEDFQLKPDSRTEGYNVCLGPFMQTVRQRDTLVRWLNTLSETGVPVPFMALSENHNVPRAVTWSGGPVYALYAQAVGAFLPGVPYVHGGLEVAETRPVNIGFDFSEEQRAAFPPEKLYLFSAGSYDWTNEQNLVEPLRRLHHARERYADMVTEPAPGGIRLCPAGNGAIVGFLRGDPAGVQLLLLANSDMSHPQAARLEVGASSIQPVEVFPGVAGANFQRGKLALTLAPGEVVVYELRVQPD